MKKPYDQSDKPWKGSDGKPGSTPAEKMKRMAKKGKKGVNPFAKVKT